MQYVKNTPFIEKKKSLSQKDLVELKSKWCALFFLVVKNNNALCRILKKFSLYFSPLFFCSFNIFQTSKKYKRCLEWADHMQQIIFHTAKHLSLWEKPYHAYFFIGLMFTTIILLLNSWQMGGFFPNKTITIKEFKESGNKSRITVIYDTCCCRTLSAYINVL